MPTQLEFEEKVNKFMEFEDTRGSLAPIFTNLIKEGKDLEAYLLILSTWNFAGFRYVLRAFDIRKFKQVIREINPIFDKLKDIDFKSADFDKLRGDVSFIYNKLNDIVKQTGATKIMHFKCSKLFVMWDMNIRKYWKIAQTKTTSDDYINFLKLMQKEFSDIKWENKDITLARAIDEYNFVVTQEKIRSK